MWCLGFVDLATIRSRYGEQVAELLEVQKLAEEGGLETQNLAATRGSMGQSTPGQSGLSCAWD